jgi:hypothetical protein
MPTTTNFGWTTPADTDLVKDGAAAIRTLGNGIDTSLLDLKGGTTNQVLAKNSNTDLDFKWVADATGIPATIFDAKGDIIAATAADTADRLAVGTNGQVLTADSTTATGLKWAPATSAISYALLNAGGTSLSGSTTTISSLSGYDFLYVYIVGGSTSSTSSIIEVRLNADTGSNYYQSGANAYYNTSTTPMLNGGSDATTRFGLARMGNNAGNAINGVITINAANSTGIKQVNIWAGANGSSTPNGFLIGGHYAGSSVISSISIITSDTFDAGTVFVYGAN